MPDSAANPHSALTLPGHTQGQHYTGYTWDEGDREGRERRGEKERESARALVLEKGRKKEPYLKDGRSCSEAVFPWPAGSLGPLACGPAEMAPGPPYRPIAPFPFPRPEAQCPIAVSWALGG